jgi:DNA-directed RNA polymerase specialized sigma24 family protein
MSASDSSEGLDEPDEDIGPDDGPEGKYRTDNEVRAALAELSPRDIVRLVGLGRIRAIGTDLTAEDLFNTAVERLLDSGRRHWRRDETLGQCVARTMTSLAKDWWRRRKRVSIQPESRLGKADSQAMAIAKDDTPGADRMIIAQQEFREIKALLKDDKNTLEIAMLLAEGETPADVREAYGLTQTQYDSLLKRIVRARKKGGDR